MFFMLLLFCVGFLFIILASITTDVPYAHNLLPRVSLSVHIVKDNTTTRTKTNRNSTTSTTTTIKPTNTSHINITSTKPKSALPAPNDSHNELHDELHNDDEIEPFWISSSSMMISKHYSKQSTSKLRIAVLTVNIIKNLSRHEPKIDSSKSEHKKIELKKYFTTDGQRAITSNHIQYCQLHNYSYFQLISILDKNVSIMWNKPSFIEKFLQPKRKRKRKQCNMMIHNDDTNSTFCFDYILFIDFDALFVNLTQTIENIIVETKKLYSNYTNNKMNKKNEMEMNKMNEMTFDITVATDSSCIANTGVMLIKNSYFSKEFLREWIFLGKQEFLSDWGDNNRWRFGDQGGFIALLNGLYLGYIANTNTNTVGGTVGTIESTQEKENEKMIDQRVLSLKEYFNSFQHKGDTPRGKVESIYVKHSKIGNVNISNHIAIVPQYLLNKRNDYENGDFIRHVYEAKQYPVKERTINWIIDNVIVKLYSNYVKILPETQTLLMSD